MPFFSVGGDWSTSKLLCAGWVLCFDLPLLLCAFLRICSESGAKMGDQANHNAIMYPLGITEHFYNCFYKRHTNDEIGSQFLGKFMLTSITNVILFE